MCQMRIVIVLHKVEGDRKDTEGLFGDEIEIAS